MMAEAAATTIQHALVVEDDPVFQQALAEAVTKLEGAWMIHCFRHGQDAIAFCVEGACPALALVDLGLPDCSGVEVIRALGRHCPRTPVMVVSVFADESRVLEAIRAGAVGYLLKSDPGLLITQAIDQLLAGVYPLSPMLANYLFKLARRGPTPNDPDAPSLTSRETELLTLISEGNNYAECAQAMGITLSGVQAHVRNLYRKLGAHSQLQAVKLARQKGLLL